MKRLVLLLLLANLAYFGWQQFGPGIGGGRAAPADPETAPKLVMLAEVPLAQRPAPRATLVPDELPAGVETPPAEGGSPSAAEVPPAATCFHLAGFPSAPSATRTKATLEKAGAAVGSPVAERFARTRYWVLLPPSRNPAAAQLVVERLKQAGMKDYYLIPEGPNRNAISLGVFSSQEGARRRVADVTPLRLKVRVEKVDYPGRRFALDLRWSAAVPADWQGKVPPGIELTGRACETAP